MLQEPQKRLIERFKTTAESIEFFEWKEAGLQQLRQDTRTRRRIRVLQNQIRREQENYVYLQRELNYGE